MCRSPDADALPNANVPLPPHAYVPGQTARHTEAFFDAVKQTVQPDLPVNRLHETQAWRAGLWYLDAGFYWECHEVLEAVWMQTPQGSPEREMTQALIQLANARLKLLMKRPRAVVRLCAMVETHLAGCGADQTILGINRFDVESWVAQTLNDVRDLQNNA